MNPTVTELETPAIPLTGTAELLRFATAGSVDDGKSTLVGRLLYDSKSILSDQLAAVEQASHARGMEGADLALLTDGLRAEREQGITIDVAYRYFSTPKRSFILADTPGHVEYTRNMVTGASTADLTLILVDARHGIVEQTRRHAAIAALLNVPHVVLAVNKMDLVDFSQERFDELTTEFNQIARTLGVDEVTAIPVSALLGDNVVTHSEATPWYDGPHLLEHLEQVSLEQEEHSFDFRLPVQYINRPRTAEHHDYRGYAGRVASGSVAVDDEVIVQPSGHTTKVTAIDLLGKDVQTAHPGQSITLQLADDIDIVRGDVITSSSAPAPLTNELTGTICVVGSNPVAPGQRVLVRIGPRTVRGIIGSIVDRLDLETLEHIPHTEPLVLNEVGTITVRLAEQVPVDSYKNSRSTGAFILVDSNDGATVAGGMAL
ncbi:MAG: GTP-binding protein [Candidatus Nanopelagicales bacterium]